MHMNQTKFAEQLNVTFATVNRWENGHALPNKQAPVETMKRNYLMFHTMAPEVAIEDLKEIYKQRHCK